MFDRFSENARRSLFFSRYEVSQSGGTTIEPEHLLLGVLHGAPQAILHFVRGGVTAESVRAALEAAVPRGEKPSTSVEVPFSSATKDALKHTVVEADLAGNRWIVPEHLVLGVLVETFGGATRVLQEAGVDAEAMRQFLAAMPDEAGEAQPEAHAAAAGVIARQWKGVVQPGKADAYLAHLRQETIPALIHLEGFLQVGILRREVEDGTEFQVTTFWRSVTSIEAFAGRDVTRAVVPPAAARLLVRYDDHALHFEIVQ